jgi:hypothetical protein
MVKVMIWYWIKPKVKDFSYDFYQWSRQPHKYLRMILSVIYILDSFSWFGGTVVLVLIMQLITL